MTDRGLDAPTFDPAQMDAAGDAFRPIAVRVHPRRAMIERWALTLTALAIPHRIVPPLGHAPGPDGHALLVRALDVDRAVEALDAGDRDEIEAARPAPPVVDHGRQITPYATAAALAVFFLVAGGRENARGLWHAVGAADAAAILGGQLWRTVTALTLHADALHLGGNLIALLIFMGAASRILRGGLALALTVLAGATANFVTAWFYGGRHVSIGASTATFAALGLLAALVFQHRLGRGVRFQRWRRAWPVLGAAAALFAMTGVGDGDRSIDVMAHATGLGAGVLVGAPGRLWEKAGAVTSYVAGGLATALVVLCWVLARM